LDEVDIENTKYLWGLFGEDHVPYDDDRKEGQDPTLAEMVTKAIEVFKIHIPVYIYVLNCLYFLCNFFRC